MPAKMDCEGARLLQADNMNNVYINMSGMSKLQGARHLPTLLLLHRHWPRH